MKKIFVERGLAFFLVFIALIVSAYLYKQGKISFLPNKGNPSVLQNITVGIPFTEKEYKLSYRDKPLSSVVEIAKFEDGEKWTGDGELNFSDYFEGRSSLALSSQNHARSRASLKLEKKFNFDDFSNYKLFVNLRSEFSNIEEFNVFLVDEESKIAYKYPIREMNNGWNVLDLSNDKFSLISWPEVANFTGALRTKSNINKVVIELVSRPKTAASVNIDYLWAEKDKSNLDDWIFNIQEFLFLRQNQSFLNLVLANLGGNGIANIKRITSARNYIVKAQFTPLSSGSFGFFLRGDYKSGFGYFFVMEGTGSNGWQIYKNGIFDQKQQSTVLAKGSIDNFQMERQKLCWLKAELKDNHLTFYLSLNDKDYVKIGEADDNSFSSGGVGIYSGGNMLMIDDIQFFQETFN